MSRHRYEVHPDLTLLISTSGSTGSPKFVRLSCRNLLSNATQINLALANPNADRCFLTSPMFNGFGQSVIHTAMLAGGSVVVTRDRIFSPDSGMPREAANAIKWWYVLFLSGSGQA
jgi:acyl-CoA synthetase (AMP-forming)/AMP-acid ligase II